MTEETCFLNGQPVHESRPLDSTTGAGGDLPIVAGIVGSTDLAHASAQIGLQEAAPAFADDHAGAIFEERLPVMAFRRRHIGQGLQCTVNPRLPALPLAHAHSRTPPASTADRRV